MMKKMMENKLSYIRLVILLLVFSLTVGLLSACNQKQGNNTSSGGSSSDVISSDEQSSSEPDESDDGSSEEYDDESDDGSSEEYDDESNKDDTESEIEEIEDEIFIDNLRVQNAGAPMSDKFLGGGTVLYNCYAYMKDNLGRNYTDQMAQIEFDRLQNMGIKRVRTIFKFLWAWDAQANTWNWESDDMKAVYRWISEMQKRGIDVMLNPWSFEYYVEGTGISDVPYLKVENDFAESCNRFSDAVTELFRQMKARGLNNAKYLVLFTEPSYPRAENQYMGEYNPEYIQIAKAVHGKLTAAGLRNDIKIIGPNQSNVYNSALLDKCLAEAPECFDIFSTHSYPEIPNLLTDMTADNVIEKWSMYTDAMKRAGSNKSFWIDEYNVRDYSWSYKGYSNIGFDDPWRGTQQAIAFATGMNLGVDNMSLWTLVDQQWPNQSNSDVKSGFYSGELRHGLLPSMLVSMIPKTQYYSYSLISKYFGNGGKSYYSASEEGNTGVYISAVNTNEGEWSVMVVNSNYESVKVNVSFDKALPGVKMFRHRYSPGTVNPTTQAAIIDADKTYHNVTKGFSDIIESGGVSVYTTIKG